MFKGRTRLGVVLLEFERGGGRLLTHWRAYEPAPVERYANPGPYFARGR